MTGLAELEQRVTALEEAVRRDRVAHNADIASVKRDLRTVLDNQDKTLAEFGELNRRVAVVELTMKQISDEQASMRAEQAAMRAEHAAFRSELPSIIAETMRDVLRESRGKS